MSEPNYPKFVQVATAGEEAIGLGEPLSMTLGSITDPEEAFRTAYAMWSLWVLTQESGYETIIHFIPPKHIEGKIFQIEANPMLPLRDILAEVKAMAERIANTTNGTLDWLGHSFDVTGITLRVKTGATMFDVRVDTDLDQLFAKWQSLEKKDIPVFGESLSSDVPLTTGDVVIAL